MKTLISGIHDLAFPDYQAINAINKSGLDRIERSPAHYQAYLKEPEEPTEAMILGQATHSGILEPESLYRNFVAAPEGMVRNEKHAKYQEFLAANPGKQVLKAADFARVEAMMKAVRSKPMASKLLSGGKAEQSILWQDPEHGVLCKARPDYLGDTDALVDLKTCESAQFREFQKSVIAYRMHVQAAWYLDGANAVIGRPHFKRFILLAVERSAPHEIMAYEFDAEVLKIGRLEARRNLRTYAECLKKSEWPGYPTAVQIMTLPEWVQ